MDEKEAALVMMKKGILKHPESELLRVVNAGFLYELKDLESCRKELSIGLELNPEAQDLFFEAFPDYSEDEIILDMIKNIKGDIV